MELALGNAWLKLNTYYGLSAVPALFVAALMYLFYKRKESKSLSEKTFMCYSIFFWLIYFLPPTAYIIGNYMIGYDVYWRMFWLFPEEIIIAYVMTKIVTGAEGAKRKLVVLVACVFVIINVGNAISNLGYDFDKLNWQKLSSETLAVCETIENDSVAKGIEPNAVVCEDLVSEIRVYDPAIKMPYGRNALRAESMDERSWQLYDVMHAERLDANRLAFYMERWDVPYVVYSNDDENKAKLIAAGFSLIGEAGSNAVYYLDEDYSDYWLVTQFGDVDGSQLMCYLIQNIDGYTIMVDGGTPDYEESVRYVLNALGDKVDAWIITHPHDDHVSVFNAVCKNPDGIEIKNVYAVDMADPSMIEEQASWDSVDAYNDFLSLDIENLNYVHKGDILDFDGLTVKVLSAYDDYVDELSDDLLNDGSMMFKVTNKENSMLFCADVGKKMSDYLLNEYGEELKADYLQMGHHGNGGLKADFYTMVSPSVALFDAPSWLMANIEDKYTTVENRKLMQSGLGASVLSFESAPNSLVLR